MRKASSTPALFILVQYSYCTSAKKLYSMTLLYDPRKLYDPQRSFIRPTTTVLYCSILDTHMPAVGCHTVQYSYEYMPGPYVSPFRYSYEYQEERYRFSTPCSYCAKRQKVVQYVYCTIKWYCTDTSHSLEASGGPQKTKRAGGLVRVTLL